MSSLPHFTINVFFPYLGKLELEVVLPFIESQREGKIVFHVNCCFEVPTNGNPTSLLHFRSQVGGVHLALRAGVLLARVPVEAARGEPQEEAVNSKRGPATGPRLQLHCAQQVSEQAWMKRVGK